MKIDDVKNIAVIGAGNMGHQLAVLCAMSGFNTVVSLMLKGLLKGG